MEAAKPCKMGTRKRLRELQETAATGITESNGKTKYACIVEAHESTKKRLESTLPIAEKGFNTRNRKKMVQKFIPMPQAKKIPDAKAAAYKDWEKLEKLPAWNLDKVKRAREK